MREEPRLGVGNTLKEFIILGRRTFMKAIDRLSVIRHKSKINKDWKHTDLFRILRKNDIWIVAYENVKNNTEALRFKITRETSGGGINMERLVKLRDKVVNERYQFKALNEIEIWKSNGQNRALNLSTMEDNIVQEVIRMVLEAIYEPCFSKQSFSFRQGLGTHDVLEYLESKFRWVDWVFENGRKGEDLTIEHTQLYNVLSKKIQDVRFMNLIRKLLKDDGLRQKLTQPHLGLSQGNNIYPILANIYFNEFDKWVEKKVNMLKQPPIEQSNKKYTQLCSKIAKRVNQTQKLDPKSKAYKNLLKELKLLKKERVNIPNLAKKDIKIEYVRYANDWIIGIKGEKTLAKELNTEVSRFMKVYLKQTFYPTKSKIIELRLGK